MLLPQKTSRSLQQFASRVIICDHNVPPKPLSRLAALSFCILKSLWRLRETSPPAVPPDIASSATLQWTCVVPCSGSVFAQSNHFWTQISKHIILKTICRASRDFQNNNWGQGYAGCPTMLPGYGTFIPGCTHRSSKPSGSSRGWAWRNGMKWLPPYRSLY